ncbi:hypothetical protein [Halomicrobium mukohataei]|uniref:hypothetical protein n=1 Tax=Halomicrobium mukohataei TaxID=57705 RepID=UPI001F0FABE4|nr:hypothetical protein [Halomicrobium mukohataei]
MDADRRIVDTEAVPDDGTVLFTIVDGSERREGILRGYEEKAPTFRAGMNPTTPTQSTVRLHGWIFHAPIHTLK